MNDVEKKLKRLKNEDIIWIIYFFIVVFALYSNKLDRDYLLKKDKEAYKRENGIKDYSNIMPGHGGILDRLDSSIFVFITYIFLLMF